MEDADVAGRWADALDGLLTADQIPADVDPAEMLALVTADGTTVWPGCQFLDGRPARGMSVLLAVVHPAMVDRWSLAGWLVAPNRRLDGMRPIDAMHYGRSDQVIFLAQRMAARQGCG